MAFFLLSSTILTGLSSAEHEWDHRLFLSGEVTDTNGERISSATIYLDCSTNATDIHICEANGNRTVTTSSNGSYEMALHVHSGDDGKKIVLKILNQTFSHIIDLVGENGQAEESDRLVNHDMVIQSEPNHKIDGYGSPWKFDISSEFEIVNTREYEIINRPDGGAFIAFQYENGHTTFQSGDIFESNPNRQIVLFSLSPAGELEWSWRFFSDQLILQPFIDTNDYGQVFITAAFFADITGNFTNETLEIKNGSQAIMVASFDFDGNFQWWSAAYTSNSLAVTGATSNGEGFWMIGSFQSDLYSNEFNVQPDGGSFYLMQCNRIGEFDVLELTNNTSGDMLGQDIEEGPYGGLIITAKLSGSFDLGEIHIASNNPGYDLMVAKYNGSWEWAYPFGSATSDESASAIAVSTNGTIAIGGSHPSIFEYKNHSLVSNSSNGLDAYLIIIDSQGEWVRGESIENANYTDSIRELSWNPAGELIVLGTHGSSSFIGTKYTEEDWRTLHYFEDPFTWHDMTHFDGMKGYLFVKPNQDVELMGHQLKAGVGSVIKLAKDWDLDGVLDDDDPCPQGITGPHGIDDWDSDGCHDLEDLDDDNDGIEDLVDNCPRGLLNWVSNTMNDQDGDGCLDGVEDMDDDNDGFNNGGDACPKTPGASQFANVAGCPDSDNDGWADSIDLYPDDLTQWADNDEDGFPDNPEGTNGDQCPTQAGVIQGCPPDLLVEEPVDEPELPVPLEIIKTKENTTYLLYSAAAILIILVGAVLSIYFLGTKKNDWD